MEYGLIGETLGHSVSKEIHESLTDYIYEPHPLAREDFDHFMKQQDFRAINVTIPYKKDVIPYLYEMDESAAAIGAVNTIVNRDGKLYGYNTDMPGFMYMVKKHGVDMTDKKILILGNGGASQAVQAGCKKMGAKERIVVDPFSNEEGILTSYEECFEKHGDADIIVNATPIGMFPKVDASPVDLKHFSSCHAVFDVIANPLTTKLVAQARDLGMIGVTGLEMLVAQAKYAVEIFLDTTIDESRIDEIYKKLAR